MRSTLGQHVGWYAHDHRLFYFGALESSWRRCRHFLLLLQELGLIGKTRNHLYANPLNRYLINSTMLPGLRRDVDGGVTLYVQHESPGKDKESNWLPAPAGPFKVAMRLYWPKPE